MSTFRYVFLLIYFLFHALLLMGSILTISKIRESDFKFINGFINDENLLLNSSNLITFTVLGLILFGINALMLWMDSGREKKKLEAKDREIIELKAKLFDIHGTKPVSSGKPAIESEPNKSQED
jgi:predicted membrane protein